MLSTFAYEAAGALRAPGFPCALYQEGLRADLGRHRAARSRFAVPGCLTIEWDGRLTWGTEIVPAPARRCRNRCRRLTLRSECHNGGTAVAMPTTSRAPWKRRNPRKASGKKPTHLSAGEKATAKARAQRAGRHYPNLVDNMRVAAAKKQRSPANKSANKVAKKSATKRRTSRSAAKR
jgi:hypothetical protein